MQVLYAFFFSYTYKKVNLRINIHCSIVFNDCIYVLWATARNKSILSYLILSYLILS